MEKIGSAVFVELGSIGTGIIYGKEFYEAKDILKDLKVGDEIFAKAVELENEEGYIELSLTKAGRELAWKTLWQRKEKDETIAVKILGANRGGLLTKISEVPAFIPVSQLSFQHYPKVERGDKLKILEELKKLVGKELKVKIFDINQEEEKLILSEKAQEFSNLREVLKNLKKGSIVDGEVSGIVDFGAFVKFPPPSSGRAEGVYKETIRKFNNELPSPAPTTNVLVQGPAVIATSMIEEQKEENPDNENSEQTKERGKKKEVLKLEGLVHISELDWQLVDDPAKVVKIGQKVKAKIIEVSDDRISLSLKALKKDPWEEIEKKYKKGDTIRGEVIKFNPFGAFVHIKPEMESNNSVKIQGLVHISEFGNTAKMQGVLEIGEEYDFQIIQIDRERHKIALKPK